jgi:hypothetical protein
MVQPFGSDSAILENADSAVVAKAAGNAPSSGSVTQSSNGDGAEAAPTTTDVATATIGVDASTGELQWTVEVTDTEATTTISVSSESDDVLGRSSPPDSSYDGIELFKQEDGGGRLWVDVYTDFDPVATTSPTQTGDSSGGATVVVAVGDGVAFGGTSAGGINITTGGLNVSGTHNGMPGRFVCDMNCEVVVEGGSITNVMNVGFIPQMLTGTAVEVGDTVTGNTIRGRGTLNGESGRFSCDAGSCGLSQSNGRVTRVENIRFTPDDATAATTTTTYPDDPDYLVGGIWVYAPDGASGPEDYEFGAFVDGNDPFTAANLDGLTGTAEYAGEATGVYTDATEDRNYFFDADVSLTANFDDADEEISGTISGFEVDGDPVEGDPMLMLETAGIEITNFFTGDTSMTFDGDDFTGKWGGQFYGNGANAADHPGSVAGTFGGATVDGDKAFLGVFGAHR